MGEELTCWVELPDRKVSVRIAVHEEPVLPTPMEHGRARLPSIVEWPDIVGKLARLEISGAETNPFR